MDQHTVFITSLCFSNLPVRKRACNFFKFIVIFFGYYKSVYKNVFNQDSKLLTTLLKPSLRGKDSSQPNSLVLLISTVVLEKFILRKF